MKTSGNKNLILSLIKDDLINTKLVRGLDRIGLDAGDYFLNLSDTIFNLMEIREDKKGERLFERYLKLKNKVVPINISKSNGDLETLALEIYLKLKRSL